MTHMIDIFTGLGPQRRLGESDTLDGGDVLPGFALNIRELFAELPPE